MDQPEQIERVYDDGYKPLKRGVHKPIKYMVNENGCWVCTSHAKSKHRGNYPVIERKGKQLRLSRYVFEIENGYIDNDKYVMHSCDNTECINPEHLSLGTPKENTQDMINKKRKPVGEKVRYSKLKENQVIEIFHSQKRQVDLVKEYGVTKKVIYDIKKGNTWKHLNLLQEVDKLSESERGVNGYGSTGVNYHE